MKCAQVKLAERKSARRRRHCCEPNLERPVRYCQLKQVNPQYEENSNWKPTAMKRFHLTSSNSDDEPAYDSSANKQTKEDTNMNELFLTVLNIDFPTPMCTSRCGLNRRNKFKFRMYPKSTDKCYHRMFVKEPLDSGELEYEYSDSTSSVQLDYVKTLLTGDERSTTSTPLRTCLSPNNEFTTAANENTVGTQDFETDLKDFPRKNVVNVEPNDYVINDTTYDDNENETSYVMELKKPTRRKSITTSRTQSPETVQVIRVDVMCNYSRESSMISERDDNYQPLKDVDTLGAMKTKALQKFNILRRSHLNVDNENLAIHCKSLKFNERPASRVSK